MVTSKSRGTGQMPARYNELYVGYFCGRDSAAKLGSSRHCPDTPPSSSSHGIGVRWGTHGEATMAVRILGEVLLFSCGLAFAMGVVLAAASMLQG